MASASACFVRGTRGDSGKTPSDRNACGTGLSIGFTDEPQFGMSFAIWKVYASASGSSDSSAASGSNCAASEGANSGHAVLANAHFDFGAVVLRLGSAHSSAGTSSAPAGTTTLPGSPSPSKTFYAVGMSLLPQSSPKPSGWPLSSLRFHQHKKSTRSVRRTLPLSAPCQPGFQASACRPALEPASRCGFRAFS